MTYDFSSTQNNGRIVSSVDAVTGENVSYTYDSLNRLIAAATTNSSGPIWGNSYRYDGFGNLTGKTVTQGRSSDRLRCRRAFRRGADRQQRKSAIET